MLARELEGYREHLQDVRSGFFLFSAGAVSLKKIHRSPGFEVTLQERRRASLPAGFFPNLYITPRSSVYMNAETG